MGPLPGVNEAVPLEAGRVLVRLPAVRALVRPEMVSKVIFQPKNMVNKVEIQPEMENMVKISGCLIHILS